MEVEHCVSKLTSSQVSLGLRVKGEYWRNGKKIVMRFLRDVSLLTTQGSLRFSEGFLNKLSSHPLSPSSPLLISVILHGIS